MGFVVFKKNGRFAQMKNWNIVIVQTLWFLVFSITMFLFHWLFVNQEVVVLSYKIHFLLFFITFIGVATVLLAYILGKRNILGFIFLGFVIFKLFAIGYIAVFEPDFKNNLLIYFMIYWFYLAVETVLIIGLVKKQDENHKKN